MQGGIRLKAVALVLVVFMFSGCGAIIRGRYQDLPIKTTPAGVTARIDEQQCVTPCTLTNISRRTKTIEIILKDGREGEFDVNRKISAWLIADIVFGAFVFPIMDNVSGGLWQLQPVDIDLNSEKVFHMPGTAFSEAYQQPVSAPTTTILR
jgi:hypothetical protein